MKKNYIYILLITVLLVISLFVFDNDTKTFKIDGIRYAVSVNGQEESAFPDKGPYEVTMSCTGADGVWNYHEWVGEISNITGSVSCNIEFISTTKTTLNNHIINLLGTNTSVASTSNNDGSTLEIVNTTLDSAINGTTETATDYRYRGIDPNNYIWFNDELWRIIGVMDQYSHGQTGEQLVKIIRNDSIGGYVWDKSNKNNWPNGSMYSLLNTAYYNSINATGEAYCYHYSTDEPAKCNFTSGGIKEEYRGMIENVTWYLGGYASADTSANMYKYERSTDTSSTYYYSGNAETLTNTPIGLMYASDYGYAAPSTCTSALSSYSTAGCSDSDWLKQNYYEWTITHRSSDSRNVFSVYTSGYLYDYGAPNGYATRPTLYLDSSVYYINGDGSKTNPYIIAM